MAKNKTYDLNDIIPIHRIGDGYVVSKDGAITIGFKVKLQELDLMAASDFIATDGNGLNLNHILQDAIKELDYGHTFHQQDIFYYGDTELPDSVGYLSKSVKRLYCEHDFLQSQTYFFITKCSGSFLSAEYNEKVIAQFTESVSRFRIKIGILQPTRMGNDEWVEYLTNFFSCSFQPGNNNPILDLSFANSTFGDNIITGYHITGDKCINDLKVASINDKRSNSYTQRYNSRITPICWDVPCYKVVNNIIHRVAQQQLIIDCANFDSRMGFLSAGLAGQASEAARYYKTIIEQNNDNGVLHSFNIFFVYPPDSDSAMKESIESAFNRVKIRPSLLSYHNKEHIFMHSIGGCTSALEYPLYLHPSLINEAVCFSNLENNYNQADKGIVLADMRGNPCIVDLFDAPYKRGDINNWNVMAFGPTGSGKSVTMNKIVSSLLMNDYFFFIIDNGNSYYNLCQMLGVDGRYIRLDAAGSQLSFNPFLLPMINPATDTERYLDAELEVIRDVLFLAWDTDDFLGYKKDPNRVTYLTDLLISFYSFRYENNLEYINFTSFYEFVCREHTEGRINTKYFDHDSFVLVMKKYTKGESLDFLFNGEINFLDYTSLKMIVVELGDIKERSKDLYKIVIGMTMILANRIIEHLPKVHKQFIIDEAWALVMEEFFGDFLRHQYKTIRKKGGGLTVIMQEVNDLAQSPHFLAISNASDTIILLSHETKEAQISDNKYRLSFTDEDASLALSIKKSDHAVFIKQGAKSRAYKVKLSPEEYTLFSTTKSEILTFKQYIAQCANNITLAVTKYCQDKSKEKETKTNLL